MGERVHVWRAQATHSRHCGMNQASAASNATWPSIRYITLIKRGTWELLPT